MSRLSRYAGVQACNTERYLQIGSSVPSKYDKSPRAKRYKCTICGEEVLTYVHANRHGFKSKEDMIEKGFAVRTLRKH
jgi:hypothetical protein